MTTTIIANGNVSVTTGNKHGGQIHAVSAQWRTRPDDERFDSIEALHAATLAHRQATRMARCDVGTLRLVADGDDVKLVGKSGKAAGLTHSAFGQVAAKAGAPASYLRKLPAANVVADVNHGLALREPTREDQQEVLVLREGAQGLTAHAWTTDRHAKLWNHEVAEGLLRLQERHPAFGFPTPFRSASGATDAGEGARPVPTAFASDHDLFVFLTDQQNVIEVQGSRLFRGFYARNNEHGLGSLDFVAFLYDRVCCNLIVWGVQQTLTVRMRHVGSIRETFLAAESPITKALSAFATRRASDDQAIVTRAQRTLVADTREETIERLLSKRISGLTETALDAAYTIVEETPRYGDPRSVWGVVNGLTEYSQRTPHADERIALDRAAGKVMQIAF